MALGWEWRVDRVDDVEREDREWREIERYERALRIDAERRRRRWESRPDVLVRRNELVPVHFVNALTGAVLGTIRTFLPYRVDQRVIRVEVGLDLRLYACTTNRLNRNLQHVIGSGLSEQDREMRLRILENVGGGVLPWRVRVDLGWARGDALRIPLLRRPTISCSACSRTRLPAGFTVAPWLGSQLCLHCILDEDRINENVGICDMCERHGRIWPLIDVAPICTSCTADLRGWESSDDELDEPYYSSEDEVCRCWDCGAQGAEVSNFDTWELCSDCFVSWPHPS